MRGFIKQLQKHAAEWRLAFFFVEILMFNKRPQTFFNLWQKPDIFCQRGSRQKAHVLPREDPLVRKYSLRTLWNLFLWGTNGDFFLLNLWWKCSIKHQYGHLDGGWWIHSPSVPPVLKACVVPILHSISFLENDCWWLFLGVIAIKAVQIAMLAVLQLKVSSGHSGSPEDGSEWLWWSLYSCTKFSRIRLKICFKHLWFLDFFKHVSMVIRMNAIAICPHIPEGWITITLVSRDQSTALVQSEISHNWIWSRRQTHFASGEYNIY